MSKELQLAETEEHWLSKLNQDSFSKMDPFIFSDKKVNYENTERFYLDENDVRRVEDLCNHTEESVYIFLSSVLAALIHKYRAEEQFGFLSPVNQFADYEFSGELFFHQFAIQGEQSFKEVFLDTKSQVVENLNYGLGFDELSTIISDRFLQEFLVFGFVLNDGTYSKEEAIPLVLFKIQTEGQPYVEVSTRFESYAEGLLELFVHNFGAFLTQIIKNLNEPVQSISCFSQKEKELKKQFVPHEEYFSLSKNTVRLILENTLKTPEKKAIICEAESITYGQLEAKTNQIARYLEKEYTPKVDELFGIMMERSPKMIMSILSVWKTGAAYVPLGTDMPDDHIEQVISDSGLKRVFTDDLQVVEQLKRIPIELEIILWSEMERGLDVYSTDPIENKVEDGALAYIIYTSGSTGKPKGVMIEHIGMLNHIGAKISEMGMDSGSMVAQNAPHTFDISIWQFFAPLVSGGTTVIYTKDVVLDAEKFIDELVSDKITVLELVPSYFLEMLSFFESGKDSERELIVQILILNAETLTSSMVDRWLKLYPHIPIVNTYGATEVSDDISHHIMTEVPQTFSVPVMNHPIQGVEVYIVNKDMIEVPIGASGEIILASEFVGRGYVDLERSKASFLPGPIEGLTDQLRIYKTGDLGRFLPSGQMEFLGRTDNQVKIRGHRIELGAIENVMSAVDGIKDCKAIAFIDRQIIAVYYLADDPMEKKTLDAILGVSLPQYMIPSAYVFMERFPLTKNGKVDKKKLPDPDQFTNDREIIPLSGPKEKLLGEVWKEVLGRKEISARDNFYDLGGDSIKSIQVVARLKQKGYTVKVEHILRHPVLAGLAPYIEVNSYVADQKSINGFVPFTPIQKTFFETESYSEKHHFNLSVLLRSQKDIQKELVAECAQILAGHHDMLRVGYENKHGLWKQFVNEIDSEFNYFDFFDFTEVENVENEIAKAADVIQRGFDLEKGPLFKLILFKTNNEDFVSIIGHHLLLDGISVRILVEDFSELYKQLSNGKRGKLQPKTDSYLRWTEILEAYAETDSLFNEVSFWNEKLAAPFNDFPVERNEGDFNLNQTVSLTLNEELTELLQTRVNKVYNTSVGEVLLTAFVRATKSTFNINEILFNVEGHGREELIDKMDLSRTVGWFTCQFPLAIAIEEENNFETDLIIVKEELRSVPNNGIGYGILRKFHSEKIKEVKGAIEFNYLGDFGTVTAEDDSIFKLTSGNLGFNISVENISEVKLEVNALIAEKKLTADILFADDNFSEKTIERLSKAVQVELEAAVAELSDVSNRYKTPSDLTTTEKIDMKSLKSIPAYELLEDIYELAPLQEGIYFHWLTSTDPNLYFAQTAYRISGVELDEELLAEVFDELVNRHSILRTSFTNNLADRPLQIVYQKVKSKFQFLIFDSTKFNTEAEYTAQVKNQLKEEGFDLENPSQTKLVVIEFKRGVYEFIWSSHHILMDGWCIGIMINEFYEILKSHKMGGKSSLPETVPYSEYIYWLRKVDKNKSFDYWKKRLDGYNQLAEIPFKRKIRIEGSYKEEVVKFQIKGELYDAIEASCRKLEITVSSFLHGLWGIQLARYNAVNDVVFGSVVSGRPPELHGVEQMVGLFINTIPVRITFDKTITLFGLLKSIHDEYVSSGQHHYLNLTEVQMLSELGMNLMGHIMGVENYPRTEALQQQNDDQEETLDVDMESFDATDLTNYDFNVFCFPSDRQYMIEFRYNGNLYEKEDVGRIKNHFANLVEIATVVGEDKEVVDIDFLSAVEKESILKIGRSETISVPEKSIGEMFETIAEKIPGHIALVTEKGEFTYEELDLSSNKLGFFLENTFSLNRESRIGVLHSREKGAIEAFLGILKSGNAFVPFDPQLPETRALFMLEDAGIEVLITEPQFLDLALELKKNSNTLKSIVLTGNINNPIEGVFTQRDWMSEFRKVETKIEPNNLAYVIYTSGSTGTPKGVMVEHKNVLSLIQNMDGKFMMKDLNVFAATTNFMFDISVFEILGTLLTGRKMILFSEETLINPEKYTSVTIDNEVQIMQLTPSRLIQLDALLDDLCKGDLKVLLVGGEALRREQFEKLRKFDDLNCINGYGPTETTIWSTALHINQSQDCTIGNSLINESVYVMDEFAQLVPKGAKGELCIAGNGVARGYLNRPELTKERFMQNPFNANEMIYRTGDLVQWTEDNELKFLGRKDDQIKLFGYRIEIGDIENAITQIEGITQSVVLVQERGGDNKVLTAFYKGGKSVENATLRNELLGLLPAYMIPANFVQVDEFPLTLSGKVNRRLLLEKHQLSGDNFASEKVAPRNKIEKDLVEIWSAVLGLEHIGVTDNFFALGGHSIHIVHLLGRIYRKFNFRLQVENIFNEPTIEKIAEEIQRLDVIGDGNEELDENEHVRMTI